MLEVGQVSKHHQVSTDRTAWVPIYATPPFMSACTISEPESPPSMKVDKKENAQPTTLNLEPEIRMAVPPPMVSSDEWYYMDGDKLLGPISRTELGALRRCNVINNETMVVMAGGNKWIQYKTMSLLPGVPAPKTGGIATPIAHDEMHYAGFWLRAMAIGIDILIISSVELVVLLIWGFAMSRSLAIAGPDIGYVISKQMMTLAFVPTLFCWLYFAIQESSIRQATLGKRIAGIIVVDMNGQRIGFGKASVRFFARFFSSLIFMLGYFMAAFTKKKQALHDIIAHTLVIRR